MNKTHMPMQRFMYTYLDILQWTGFSEEEHIQFSDPDADLQYEVDTHEEEATL